MPKQLTFSLLITLVAIFLVSAFMVRTDAGMAAFSLLMLDPAAVVHDFQIWRLFTYAFLHDVSNPLHLLFNGMLLYFIGPDLESRWGTRRFGFFVTLTALGGGLFVVCAWWLHLARFPVIGFSAVSLGLLIAWGLTFPYRQLLLFGIVPVTGRNMVYLTIGLEILYAISTNDISSAAHFGGIATALVLTLGIWKPSKWKFLNKKKNIWQ